MDFKIAKACSGCERVIKNMSKLTGDSTGDIEDGVERTMGKMEVPEYLGAIEKEGKAVSKQIVDKMNAGSKAVSKRLEKKMEGDIAFRGKGKKRK
jgi:hypothetical protein